MHQLNNVLIEGTIKSYYKTHKLDGESYSITFVVDNERLTKPHTGEIKTKKVPIAVKIPNDLKNKYKNYIDVGNKVRVLGNLDGISTQDLFVSVQCMELKNKNIKRKVV